MSVGEHRRPDEEGEPTGNGEPAPGRRRRILIASGVGGLAVVAGVSVFFASGSPDGPDATTADRPMVLDTTAGASAFADAVPTGVPGAVVPSAAATTSLSAASEPAASEPATSEPATAATTPAKAAPVDPDVRKKIDAAREKAERDGVKVERPLQAPADAPAPRKVDRETRALPDGGTMRIISAAGDLSHQNEMLWAADQGKSVGSARCTSNFRFSQGGPAGVRPTMVLCWRLSAARSVLVVSVARKGSPSPDQAVAALDESWRKR